MKRLSIVLLGMHGAFATPAQQNQQLFGLQESPDSTPLSPEYDPNLFKPNDQVFTSHLEFLYWTVKESALDYALKMNQTAWSPSENSYAQGRFKNATYNIDPGFRVGFSFFRAPRFWEIKAQYTRVTNRGKTSAGAPNAEQEYLTATWPSIFTSPVSEAESQIHLNYNVVDVFFDRFFNPNPHLRLRLAGGLTGAWIQQDWKIHYFDSIGDQTVVRNRWKFGGAGMRFGLMTDWFWFANIFATAEATTAILIGNYHNIAEQTTNFSTIPVRNANYSDERAVFTGQVLLGPSYQKNFQYFRTELFAGYELTAWSNLNEVFRSTAGTPTQSKETWINSSLFAIHGLTTRLTVDY